VENYPGPWKRFSRPLRVTVIVAAESFSGLQLSLEGRHYAPGKDGDKLPPLYVSCTSGFRSACETEATYLLRGVHTAHLDRGQSGSRHTRRRWRPGLPRRSILVSAGYWRREQANCILEVVIPQKRGPKSRRHSLEEENQKLQRENARLTEELCKAHLIIEVQKKWRRCNPREGRREMNLGPCAVWK
jgi:hypothetical protein